MQSSAPCVLRMKSASEITFSSPEPGPDRTLNTPGNCSQISMNF